MLYLTEHPLHKKSHTVCGIMDFKHFYGFFYLTQEHLSKENYSKITTLF